MAFGVLGRQRRDFEGALIVGEMGREPGRWVSWESRRVDRWEKVWAVMLAVAAGWLQGGKESC